MLKNFRKIPVWLILLIVIVPAFYLLIRPGFFPMQDDLQAFRIQQMDTCFADFQIPCRWIPDMGYQYGYPEFNFYPPGVYYLGEAIHLLGFQFIDTVKILFILGFGLAAVSMYIFLKSFFGVWPAFVGAILYTFAPYRAVDVYVRGALSEFWAFVFFPLIFWSIYKLVKSGKLKYLAWMGLSTGLLLITHSLMSMIFLPLAAVWGVTWVALEKRWRLLLKLFWGGVLGLGLAAFFTLPMIVEKQYSHSESMLGGYFDWRQHFVDINQLFVSNYWGYGSSQLGPGDDLSLSTGIVQWMAALLAVILVLIFFRKNKKISISLFVLSVLDMGVLFMIHQKSSFIWDKISLLAWLQFPWRLLADSVFLLAVIASGGVFLLKNKKWSVVLGIILIVGSIALYGNFFKPQKWFNLTDEQKFSGRLWEKQLTISIFDYLPIYAKLPPTSAAPKTPEILEGNVKFTKYNKGGNWQYGEAEVLQNSIIRLPLFDFPGMQVLDNGRKISHTHHDCRGEEFCLGLMTINLAPGSHTIEAKLTNTPIRTIGNILTLVSILATIGLFIKGKNEKKSY